MIYEEIFIIDSSFFFFFVTRERKNIKYLIYLIVYIRINLRVMIQLFFIIIYSHVPFLSLNIFPRLHSFFFFFLFLVFAFFFSFFFIFLSFFYLFIYFFPHFQVTLSLSLWRGENIFKNLYTAPFHLLGKKNFFENWIDIRFTVVNHTCHTRAIYFN